MIRAHDIRVCPACGGYFHRSEHRGHGPHPCRRCGHLLYWQWWNKRPTSLYAPTLTEEWTRDRLQALQPLGRQTQCLHRR